MCSLVTLLVLSEDLDFVIQNKIMTCFDSHGFLSRIKSSLNCYREVEGRNVQALQIHACAVWIPVILLQYAMQFPGALCYCTSGSRYTSVKAMYKVQGTVRRFYSSY